MRSKVLSYALVLISAVVFFTSCEDNDSGADISKYAQKYCLKEITVSVDDDNPTSLIKLDYDENKRIFEIEYSGIDLYRISYNPFTILCNEWGGISELLLNDRGYISKMVFRNEGDPFSISIEYDKNEHPISVTRIIDGVTYTTTIVWNGNGIESTKTAILSGNSDNNPYMDHSVKGKVKNQGSQWPTSMAQLIAEDDGMVPLVIGGFIGRAPEYLPTEVISVAGQYSVTTKINYSFNVDGSLSKEEGEEIRPWGGKRKLIMNYLY